MRDSIENMQNRIFIKEFNPGWGGGRWYDHQIPDSIEYVRAYDKPGEIFAWVYEISDKSVIGYFRSAKRESINDTVAYIKAQ